MTLGQNFENFAVGMGIYDAQKPDLDSKCDRFSQIFHRFLHSNSSKTARKFEEKRKTLFLSAAGEKKGFMRFSEEILTEWAYMMFLKILKILEKKWAYMTSYMVMHPCNKAATKW